MPGGATVSDCAAHEHGHSRALRDLGADHERDLCYQRNEVLNVWTNCWRTAWGTSISPRAVLAKFQHRFDEDLVELDEALLAQDAAAVASIAHRIKGASANVAAAAIARVLGGNRTVGAYRASGGRLGRRRSSCASEWSRFVDHASSLELSSRDVR